MASSSPSSSSGPPRKFKWSLDFRQNTSGSGGGSVPPGFSSSTSSLHAEASRSADPALRAKRSWDVALGPIKQVPMNLFIMYMSGKNKEEIRILNTVLL